MINDWALNAKSLTHIVIRSRSLVLPIKFLKITFYSSIFMPNLIQHIITNEFLIKIWLHFLYFAFSSTTAIA